jgi:hypothetical protein
MGKPCATCKHYSAPWGAICDHPALRKWDPVHGDTPSNPYENRGVYGKCSGGTYHEEPQGLWQRFIFWFASN